MDLSKLTDKQLDVAMKVIEEAERQGINPDFVLPLVYQESRLGQNIGPSKAGAIGVMQLMPKTAEYLGVDPNDMDQNIEGGVRYIKMLSEKLNADPNLVAVAYNAGPNSKFFKTGKTEDLLDETVTYVDSLIDYAGGTLPPPLALKSEPAKPVVPEKGFDSPPVTDEFGQAVSQAVSPPAAPGLSPPDVKGGPMGGRPQLSADEQRRIDANRKVGQQLGAMGGLGLGASRLVGDFFPLRESKGMPPPRQPGDPLIPTRARQAAQAAAEAIPESAPTTPAGGKGTQNYGKAFGLGDIESSRALDMTKQPGGVHDLTTQRSQNLQKVDRLFPGQFREDPRFGGLMTPTSPGGGPRSDVQPRIPNRPGTLAKKPSGLEQVSKAFSQIANSSPVRAAGRYALPPITIGYGLGEGMAASEGLKAKQPDYLDIGASGLGALGATLTMVPNPVVKGAGALMMGAKPALDMLRAPGTPPKGMIGDMIAP